MKSINLTKELKGKNVIFGLKRTLKFLKKDLVEKIYLAFDSPKIDTKKVEVIKLKLTKEDVKETLKKRFNISVVAVLKSVPEKTETKEKKKTVKKTKKKKEKK